MKYLILLAAGLADEPVESLGGQTPLEAAHTPTLDAMARGGKTGAVKMIPEDLPASEEVALLAALGYNPHKCFTGEGGLALGDAPFTQKEGRAAYRFNMVTAPDGVLQDHAAGQITPREAESLLATLAGALGRPDAQFHVGRGFSGAAALPQSDGAVLCAPPEALIGQPLEKHLPHGGDCTLARRIVELSRELFAEHEVNRVRADLGENPADALWPWGPGWTPVLEPFKQRTGFRGAMVAAAESARGLGKLIGLHTPVITGATGGYRTDYMAKAQAALKLIHDFDLVVLHVAAPAEASLEGSVQRKIAAIQELDAMVAPLADFVRGRDDARMMLISTHMASVTRRLRLRTAVPCVLFGAGFEPLRQAPFSEAAACSGELEAKQGETLLPYFLRP